MPASPIASPLPPVLIADDDPSARQLIGAFVRQMGLCNPLVQAVDGDDAVRQVDEAVPILALLDVRMPRRSGIEVLRWIREEGPDPDLAVVLLTGSAEIDEVNAAHDLGVSSYLVKPVGYDALGDVLRSLPIPWALHTTRDHP